MNNIFKPNQEEIDEMVEQLEVYNNAKTAEEGFGALNGLISKGLEQLEKEDNETERKKVKASLPLCPRCGQVCLGNGVEKYPYECTCGYVQRFRKKK